MAKKPRCPDKFTAVNELARRRGFFWQSYEIYGGVSGFATYGSLGARLKQNIERKLRELFVNKLGILEIESPVITPERVFEASGHIEHFKEPMVGCLKCKKRFRADHLVQECVKISEAEAEKLTLTELKEMIEKNEIHCPECGGTFDEPKQFLTMFKTTIGPYSDAVGYGRPEAAQGIFVEFKRLYEMARGKLPFGAMQIGRALRNEISPRQGLLRLREFTIVDLEFFFDPEEPDCYMLTDVENERLRLLLAETLPTYQKFIKWQYENLRDLGYVTKGTHPVVWCPKCQSPTGDHDRQVGEGVAPEEYTLIKFKLDKETFLPAATFRPETIYGVTNIWLNPEATYVEAQVNGEKWIMSKEAADKLKEQGRTVRVRSQIEGRLLVGKTFENPVTKGRLLILPGWFVDPSQATGVVYSVPAHAPLDWLALEDLKKNPESLKKFGIDPETLESIKPISLIKVEGYGVYPAADIVKQLGVKDQNDPKADEATKQLYKKEFHNGVLNENCKEYAGKMVRNVKETLINDFKRRGIADAMYDLPQAVVCRCMTPCIVKVLQDQWFLNYSDLEWKEKAKQALSKMKIYPETARQWFLTVIDWLREWACARTTGFGTPLPWGKGWIIETLSDSTIYMAFYTINKHIRQYDIEAEALTKEVFDYVFYGKGQKDEIAARTRVSVKALDEMREEFCYWYPVNLRVSAKELVPNHLTFFIFHHTALFPPKHWPSAIGVNGMLMIEGKQMHKSKGNFVTMKRATEEYSADATRCALLLGGEGMDDPDWRAENVKDLQAKLESLYNFAETIIESPQTEENVHMEKWLMSALQHRVREVTANLEEMKTRTALEIALFEVWNDFRWYVRRKGKMGTKALNEALEIWVKLLAPFAPHICEELWSQMQKKEFISLALWPEANEKLVDVRAEEKENLMREIIEDTLNVVKATKTTPKKICYYVASQWKWKVYLTVLERSAHRETRMNELMKELLAEKDLKKHSKELAKFTARTLKEVSEMPEDRRQVLVEIKMLDEKAVIMDAIGFLGERFNAQVIAFDEEDKQRYDPKQRATMAMPRRPAIYIE